MDTILNYPGTLAVIIALPAMGIIAKISGVSFSRIAKWYLYTAVFAVVVVMNSIFFPFIGGKDYFFRFVIELSLMAFILSWAFEMKPDELKKEVRAAFRKPLFVAVSIFALIFLFACLFGYDANAAFWSNYERGEGGFQMIHYYLFFVLLTLLLRTEEDWKNIFKFSLAASGLMILYGICGNFGVDQFIGPYSSGVAVPTNWFHRLVDGRFQGSLGNPAYVAPYLMFSMFYAGYLWLKSRVTENNKILIRVGYGLVIAIFVFFFMLSQTRGAFLGLGAGIFVLLLYMVFSATPKVRKWSLIAFAILVVLGGGVFTFRNSAFVQSLPEARLLQISLSDSTAQTRFWTWGSAWKGFVERPILGWGPENFTTVFDKYFDPRHFVPSQQTETWFDRAHSVFFDYLAETGVLGLLSYLAIFFVFAWEFFKSGKPTFERGLLLAIPAAYLVQGAAIFDVFPMYLSLFLFLAFAYYYFYEKHGQNV